MSGPNSNFLDPLLSPTYQDEGDPKIRRANINLIGFTVEDDPNNDALKVTNTGGGEGGTLALSDHAAFRALSSVNDGAVIHFQDPIGTFVYESTIGAGQADDDRTILKLTAISVGAVGRAYSVDGPILPTISSLRLAVSGKQSSVQVQMFSEATDGGGGIFDYDPADTTSSDDAGNLIVAGTRRYKRRDAEVFHSPRFGTKGDGASSTVDYTALVAAPAAISTRGGGVLSLPKGTYTIHDQGSTGFSLIPSNLAIRGEGRDKTTIKATGTTTLMFVHANPASENLTFEDLTFDGNNQATSGFYFFGGFTRNVTFRRCRFVNFPGIGITIQDTSGVLIEDCLFESLSPPSGTGIQFFESAVNVTIRRCAFRYLNNGILIGEAGDFTVSDLKMCKNIKIEDCHFDGGWFHLPIRTGGYTGTATFTDGTMTKTSGPAFPSIGLFTTLRIMRAMRTSTQSQFGLETYLVDAGALFTTYNLVPGDIVRSGSKFAILMGVESDTVLRVEEWLDDTTRQQVFPPANGASYTVYKTYHGRVASNNTTVITLYDTWTDRNGNIVTGADLNGFANVTYELLPDHGNYSGVHASANSREIKVLNSTFLRSWSDQISLYGDRNQVIGNWLEDGQDTGITINGQYLQGHSMVVNNHIRHHGIEGLFTTARHSLFANNVFTRNQWSYTGVLNPFYLADMVIGGSFNTIVGNVCDGEGQPQATHGIVIGGASYCLVQNNTTKGHALSGIKSYDDVTGVGTTIPNVAEERHFGNKIWHNDVSQETVLGYEQTDMGARATQTPVRVGTGVPVVTLTGGPSTEGVYVHGRIKITLGGARGTAEFQYSQDDGATYSSSIVTAATNALGGDLTGTTANFPTGNNYVVNDEYRFTACNGGPDIQGVLVGSPEDVLWASPGSKIRAVDGIEYTKRTGWGKTGWVSIWGTSDILDVPGTSLFQGEVKLGDAFLTWQSSVSSSPLITVAQASGDVHGKGITGIAQAAGSGSTNKDGGQIQWRGGKPTGTGLPGSVELQTQDASGNISRTIQSAVVPETGARVAVLGKIAGVTTGDIGSLTGDGITWIAPATGTPSSGPTTGATLCVNSNGNLLLCNGAAGSGQKCELSFVENTTANSGAAVASVIGGTGAKFLTVIVEGVEYRVLGYAP